MKYPKDVFMLTLCILGMLMLLPGCGNTSENETELVSESVNENANIEENLEGSWYAEGDDTPTVSNLESYTFTDFCIVTSSGGTAIVQWIDEYGIINRGLMDYSGDVFFHFPKNYAVMDTISDDYVYGKTGIATTDGTLLYQFPENGNYTIVACGNDIFMVKQHIENMTENTVKIGFVRSDGTWIIEPSIEADGNTYYVGNGYFAVADKSLLFINPETGHQFSISDYIGLQGASDGVAIVSTGLGTAVYGFKGIDLQTGAEFSYEFDGTILSVGDGYFASGTLEIFGQSHYNGTHIYNMYGEEVLDLSKYKIMSVNFSDECAMVRIYGADKAFYISAINLETGDFMYEPIKDCRIVTNADNTYAMISMNNENYYLNCLDGSTMDCEYLLSDSDVLNRNIHGDIFVDNSGNYYSWKNGEVNEIVPYATFDW